MVIVKLQSCTKFKMISNLFLRKQSGCRLIYLKQRQKEMSHFCVLYYMKCNQIPGLVTFVTFYFLSSSDSNSPQVVKKPPVNSSEEWSTKRTCDDTVSTISSLHSSPTVSPQGSPRKGLQPKPFLASFFFYPVCFLSTSDNLTDLRY